MSWRWGVVAVLGWRLWRSWAESKALSNVRVHGQDCGVSTCHPLGLAAQTIIKPLCGATACHYSKTQTHTQEFTHWHMHKNYQESTNPSLRNMLQNWAKECRSLSLVVKLSKFKLSQFTYTSHDSKVHSQHSKQQCNSM